MAPQISKRSLNIYFSSIYLIYKNKKLSCYYTTYKKGNIYVKIIIKLGPVSL